MGICLFLLFLTLLAVCYFLNRQGITKISKGDISRRVVEFADNNEPFNPGIVDHRVLSTLSFSTLGYSYRVEKNKPKLMIFKAIKSGRFLPITIDAVVFRNTNKMKNTFFIDEFLEEQDRDYILKYLNLQLTGDETHGGSVTVWSPDAGECRTEEYDFNLNLQDHLCKSVIPNLPGTYEQIEKEVSACVVTGELTQAVAKKWSGSGCLDKFATVLFLREDENL